MRYIPQNLSMNESAPVCQHWSYASNHPMEEMLGKDYFLSANDRLRPGDTVRIVQMRDKDVHWRDNKVIAFVDALVTQVEKNAIYFYLSKVTTISDKKPKEKENKKHVQWHPGKKEHQVLLGDEVLFASKDKKEAEKWLQKSE